MLQDILSRSSVDSQNEKVPGTENLVHQTQFVAGSKTTQNPFQKQVEKQSNKSSASCSTQNQIWMIDFCKQFKPILPEE